jgi:hypothetical protein
VGIEGVRALSPPVLPSPWLRSGRLRAARGLLRQVEDVVRDLDRPVDVLQQGGGDGIQIDAEEADVLGEPRPAENGDEAVEVALDGGGAAVLQ